MCMMYVILQLCVVITEKKKTVDYLHVGCVLWSI